MHKAIIFNEIEKTCFLLKEIFPFFYYWQFECICALATKITNIIDSD